MSMMQQMYNDGDDEMKRTIAKVCKPMLVIIDIKLFLFYYYRLGPSQGIKLRGVSSIRAKTIQI